MALSISAGEVAPSLFKRLNGIFCVYKPVNTTIGRLKFNLRHKLASDLSAMPWPERKIVKFSENVEQNVPTVIGVPDIAHTPLVLGPRYQLEDFYVNAVHPLSGFSSGINLIGIGQGARYINYISSARMVRVYHVTGELGRATSDFTVNTRTLIKTTYNHVTLAKLSKLLSAIQATHQRLTFEFSGVSLESEETCRLANQGPIRPLKKTPPLIYNIKCIDFKKPYFVLEIHCLNEICDFFKQLIDQIGRDMKSSAVCRRVHRIRVGHFGLNYALLQKHWTAENVIENIKLCRPLVDNELIQISHELSHKRGEESLRITSERADDLS